MCMTEIIFKYYGVLTYLYNLNIIKNKESKEKGLIKVTHN